MTSRIEAEWQLLLGRFPSASHTVHGNEDWFLIPDYPVPEGWLMDGQPTAAVQVAFSIAPQYPGKKPYGFFVPSALTHKGHTPNKSKPAKVTVPFPGEWRFISWNIEDWQPGSDPSRGPNLLSWTLGFLERFREGQ